MSVVLGRTQFAGLGKESVAGTPVAPTVWIPFQEMSIEDVKDFISDNSAFGSRYNKLATDTSQERAEGNFNGLIYDQSFGFMALAAMGTVSTASHSTATGVKVHTFSVANVLPTFTIAKKDANESKRMAYGMLNQLEIDGDASGYATFTSSWMGHKGETVANTPSFTQENRFRPQDIKIYIADDVDSLDAADPISMTSFKLTINNNLITDPTMGSVTPNYYPGEVETAIEFDKLYKDTTFHDLVFGTAPKALRIAMVNADVVIGSAVDPEDNTNPSVVITFEPGFFSSWKRDGGLGDLKKETIDYDPIFSFADSKMFEIAITNTESAY
jgi:hypothetical protein